VISEAHRKSDPAQQTVSPAEEVTGTIAYFKWPSDGHSPGANFGVVVNGITVIGQSDLALRRGDRIHASGGRFEDHPKWGRQYHAASIAILPPVNHNEKARLFRMGGVPPQTGKKLLAHFGKDIFSILTQEPERLAELPNIKPQTREKIPEVIANYADELLLRFLLRAGVTSKNACEIAEARSFKAVRTRPYILAHDLEFGTVDKIARDLLGERFDEFGLERVLGAIIWLLRKATHDSNCGITLIKLRNILQRDFAFTPKVIADAASYGIAMNEIVIDRWRDRDVVFNKFRYRGERRFAETIKDHAES
jgi:exodeoxyribonuclease V alpha subunit